MHFVPLAVYYGLAIYVATSSVVILAAEAERPWAWWTALCPLAMSHAGADFLAFWSDVRSRREPLICGALSGVTTFLAILVAAWMAPRASQWMPRTVAMTVLAVASLAGALGLALAVKLRRGGS